MERIAVSAVQGIYNIAASYAGKRLKILSCFDDHIERLESYVLPSMNEYTSRIEDAELKKMLLVASPTELLPQHNAWLQSFKDLTWDIEDILDEVSIRRSRNACREPVSRCKLSLRFRSRITFRASLVHCGCNTLCTYKQEIRSHEMKLQQ